MIHRPPPKIIRHVPVELELVPREGPIFENSLASKAAREDRRA
jgi:hypothetical protein